MVEMSDCWKVVGPEYIGGRDKGQKRGRYPIYTKVVFYPGL